MKILTRFVASFVIAVALGHGPASAQDRIQVGTLECDISGGLGFIIASQKRLSCLFVPAQPGAPQELYEGVINKFGLDLGATTGGRMVWAVYAPTDRWRNALAGSYVGASADASVGVGGGANLLVGGSNRTVALQPLSVQGQVGLNLAVGVADLELRAMR
jgi:uncharacterized protein DUF992